LFSRHDDVRLILSCRETLFSVLSSNIGLQESLRARAGTLRHIEVEALVSSSIINRKHGALQESLASVTYLHDIVQQCKTVGLDIEATAQHEVASVLWDQGEAETSIRMRQYLINHTDFDSQNADISLPVLLAKLVRIPSLNLLAYLTVLGSSLS
jgi:ataxia telangiectasia mutated family protein